MAIIKKSEWVNGLDSIRFILAFIVFLSHLPNPYHEFLIRSPYLIVRLIGMAWIILFSGIGAVMAFFIISGFVIHLPNRGKYPDTLPFLIRRWLRIGIPLVVISSIAGAYNQFTAIPIWSLYCELIYYTLYPLLIRVRISWENKFWITFIFSLIIIMFFAPNDWASFFQQKNINYAGSYWQLGDLFTWVVGLPCWLLGVVLAQNMNSDRKEISTGTIYMWRFLVLLAGMGLDVLKFHYYFGYFFSMNLFAPVLFFWIKKEIAYFRKRRAVPFLEFCGKFSYSLYLCHNVFTFFILKLMNLNIYTYFPVILLTTLASYIFYIVVEYPSHLLSRKAANLFKNRKMAIQRNNAG
jgi:peptidoglycan/LPS O-acetylase OafA/YrhL